MSQGRYTLLEIVQLLLSSMDSTAVNGIAETPESLQVATLVKSVFYDLANDLSLPEHEGLIQLDASVDPLKPCVMKIPSSVVRVRSIKYNVQGSTGHPVLEYKDIPWMPFDAFLDMQQGNYQDGASNVVVQSVSNNGDNFSIPCFNDKPPGVWTTIDDQTILFDSYDSTVDSTLQKSKILSLGVSYPDFLLEDGFYPDLDPSEFSLLINKAKVRAFYELTQQENVEASTELRNQKIVAQVRKHRIETASPLERIPRYGRK